MAMQPLQLTPMISTGTGSGTSTITGSMIFTTNATAFPLQLPGANHTYKKDSAVNIDGLPIYDKPLGVVSLDRTPYLSSSNTSLHYKGQNEKSIVKCGF